MAPLPAALTCAGELDQTACLVGVVRLERGELGGGRDHVEQSAGEAPMQSADDRLVLASRVAVRAVGQANRGVPSCVQRWTRLKPQCGQRRLEGLFAGCASLRGQLPSDLAARRFDSAQAARARSGGTCQPPRQVGVGTWRPSTGRRVGRDPPDIARPSALLQRTFAEDEPVLLKALQMDAHTIGMQVQLLGELDCARRSRKLGEQLEQVRPRGLGERIVRIAGARQIDHAKSSLHTLAMKIERRVIRSLQAMT